MSKRLTTLPKLKDSLTGKPLKVACPKAATTAFRNAARRSGREMRRLMAPTPTRDLDPSVYLSAAERIDMLPVGYGACSAVYHTTLRLGRNHDPYTDLFKETFRPPPERGGYQAWWYNAEPITEEMVTKTARILGLLLLAQLVTEGWDPLT